MWIWKKIWKWVMYGIKGMKLVKGVNGMHEVHGVKRGLGVRDWIKDGEL